MARNGRRTFALVVHAAVIAAAPIAIGGVHTATALALAALTLLAFVVQMRWRSRERIGWRPPSIGWVLAAYTVVVALQLVPLPHGLLAGLSPETANLRADAAALVGNEPGWAPLSLSPPATARDLLRALGVLFTTLAVAGLVRIRARSAHTLLTTVVLTGVALVTIAALQQLFQTESILGFYTPQTTQGHRFFWSTFVNQNHFAAFLCLAAPIALGLALDQATARGQAPLFVAAFAVLAIGAVLTLSRAGALVLVGELVLFAALWSLARRKEARQKETRRSSDAEKRTGPVGWGAIGAALFVVVAVALVVALPQLIAEWRTLGSPDALDDYAKVASLPDAWRLVTAFPWTGIGAGAYGEVFPAYNAQFADYTFHYVENGPLQLAADLGLPAAALLLLPGLVLFVGLVRGAIRRPLLIGAATGLTALLAENLVDFSLAMPGVALPAAAVLGVLAGKTRPTRRQSSATTKDSSSSTMTELGRQGARLGLAAGAIALLAALPAGWLSVGHSLGRTRSAVAAGTDGALADAARWHPADPVVALAAGQAAEVQADDAAAARWYKRARTLAPSGLWPALHAFRFALARDDDDEARAALAALHGTHGGHARDRMLWLELLRGRDDVGELLGPALSWDPGALVASVDALSRQGAGRTSERLLRAGLVERPDDPLLLHALAELYLSRSLHDEADRVATRLMALHPERPEGYLVLGDLALHDGEPALAEHLFREAARLAPDDIQPVFRRAEALTRLAAWGPLETVFRDLGGKVRTPRERAHLLALRSRAAEEQDQLELALRYAREAVHEVPSHVPHLRQLARLLEALERSDAALTVYERILDLRKEDGAATKAITRLRGGAHGSRTTEP